MRGVYALMLFAACGGGSASNVPLTPTLPTPPAPPAPPPVVAWARLHGLIRSVTLTGGAAADYTRVQPLLDDEVGRPLDRAQLRDRLDAAMATQTLADIQVRGEQLADGIKLIVTMTAQPKVASVVMHDASGGNQKLPGRFATATGASLEPVGLDIALDGLLDELQQAGHVAAAGHWSTKPAAGGAVDVVLDLDPGDGLVISAHEFHGNARAKAADLEAALAHEAAVGSPWIVDHVERALLLLNAYYFDHGYINISITTPPVPLHNPAVLAFTIREGEQFKYSKVALDGVSPADAKKLTPLVKLKAGQIFGRADVIAAITRVHDQLVKDGHPRASVEPMTELDSKARTIAVKLHVTLDTP